MSGRGDHRADPTALLMRVGLAGHAGRLASELTYIDQKRLELGARAGARAQGCCCSTSGWPGEFPRSCGKRSSSSARFGASG